MTMRQLGVADFSHAIVGIGGDLAASLMTVMALTELATPTSGSKAMTPEHGKIADRIGAHHVVYPEADMGERVAHLISGRMMDYIEFDDGFAIAKIQAPPATHDLSLAESLVRERFGVTVVGIKRAHEDFQHGKPSSVVLPGRSADRLRAHQEGGGVCSEWPQTLTGQSAEGSRPIVRRPFPSCRLPQRPPRNAQLDPESIQATVG